MLLRILLLILLNSCAGYRVKTMENPFKYHGIKSISIPIFVNQSNLAQVSAIFTKDIAMVLEGHDGLDIIGSDDYQNTDATLIGIIESEDSLKSSRSSSAAVYIDGELEKSIGSRQPFYIPTSTSIHLTLRLILIKKPTIEEVKLLTSFYPARFSSPQIIFSESFKVTHSFARVFANTEDVDLAGVLNQTKNYGAMVKAIKSMSKTSSNQFKELIINAF